MTEIPLNHNKVTLVDDEDYERLMQYTWCYHQGYAKTNIKVGDKYKTVSMHRIILNTPPDKDTDHVNHDTLDNRRQNLRICTTRQNMMNQKPKSKSSRFKGVMRDRDGYWITKVDKVYIGSFPTERIAAMAYDLWARDIFGEFANPNFPVCVNN